MENEIWVDVIGYEGLYKVSNLGGFLRLKDNYKKYIFKEGNYQSVLLKKDKQTKSFQLHRLIALMFIPNPENKTIVNHKNGDKHDNRVENLEWCTHSENTKHAWDTGLISVIPLNIERSVVYIDTGLLNQVKEQKKKTGITITAFIEQAVELKLKTEKK